MIEAARSWLTAVVAAAFLVSLSQSLIPEGTVRKIAGLAGGLALLLVMVKPLLGADFDQLDLRYEDYAGEIQQRQTELQEQSDQTLEELIQEKTEAYILDKAAELGVECTVRVLVEPGEDGTPIPSGAELTGQKSDALADYMEQKLGIPKERQVYHETG
jgi:stage III sporulation protein AF